MACAPKFILRKNKKRGPQLAPAEIIISVVLLSMDTAVLGCIKFLLDGKQIGFTEVFVSKKSGHKIRFVQ